MGKLTKLMLAAGVTAMAGLAMADPGDTPSKTVWGIVSGASTDKAVTTGIINWDLANPSTYTMVQPFTAQDKAVRCGVLVDGVFYWYDYTVQIYGHDVGSFRSYDTETGVMRIIADYYDAEQNVTLGQMTYDYQNSVLYALNRITGGDGMQTVDLETGDVGPLLKFTGMLKNAEYQMDDSMQAIAMNYDGDMYGVSYWGRLYKINPVSGECSVVGDLDYNPESAIMYPGHLSFDNETGDLYWECWMYTNKRTELRRINIKDATTEFIGFYPEEETFGGFSIPFTIAEASAPAKVSDLTVTPGEKGALSATISWTNPTKTYGRGGTLESLTKVDVYRDDELVYTAENPGIGATMTWTDNNVPASALYSYKVVPSNESGPGDRKAVTKFVGQGIPMPVTDLTVVGENEGAKISWSIPDHGKFDAYLDMESLRFDVVRVQEPPVPWMPKVETAVATDIKEMEYFDDSITELDKYTYTVTAHNIGGTSETVTSDPAICGPLVEAPHTFAFQSQAEFNSWITIDGNGDGSTWSATSWPVSGFKSAMDPFYQMPAHEYLISPKVKVEAGKRYKVTVDATPDNKKVIKTLAFSFGKEPTPMAQDSVNQFVLFDQSVATMRSSLPVQSESGEYHLGFVHRSNYPNYALTLSNVRFEEDHDGHAAGTVICNGQPVEGARVLLNGGQFMAVTNEEGEYKFEYIPQGSYEASVSCIGCRDGQASFSVTEYETTTTDITLEAIPAYTVKGSVKDAVGDLVTDATVTLGGYNSYTATTDANGVFEIPGVYEAQNYSVTVSRNNLLSYSANFDVAADVDLGQITLNDNLKAPRVVEVEDQDTQALVEWGAPLNDPVTLRYDDGTPNQSLGISSGNGNTVFGTVFKDPCVLYSTDFFICSSAQQASHYRVQVYVFGLDKRGRPDSTKILYQDTYVPVTDDEWTTYTFPAPIDCPNGCLIGLSYSDGFLSLAIDGAGDRGAWPFKMYRCCYTPDYTTGEWTYLESTDYKNTFLLRANAALTGPVGDDPKEVIFREDGHIVPTAVQPEVSQPRYTEEQKSAIEASAPRKAVEDRVRYNVMRGLDNDDVAAIEWETLATNLSGRSYTDTQWGTMPQGVYRYGVQATYANSETSPIQPAEFTGRLMHTDVTVNVTTNTEFNEAEGARITLLGNGGQYYYTAEADEYGHATIENVWKLADYTVMVEKDGFARISETVDLSMEPAYTLNYALREDHKTPTNLIINQEGNPGEPLFIWNFPDLIYDGFEGHEDFEIASPGEIGWQYIDGDGGQTGGFMSYEWPHMTEPMSFQVFNPTATIPALQDYNLIANTGDKFLTSWASYGVANDDWFISPRLYFQEPFKFQFFTRSYDYNYLETIDVLYSETGCEPEDFIVVEGLADYQPQSYYMAVTADIPATAKYVAIHHKSDQCRVLSIDDVRIGLSDLINPYGYYYAPASRMPALKGAYEVYLDDEKVDDTSDTQYQFTGLQNGHHRASVRAAYSSGYSDMAHIDFVVEGVSVEMIGSDAIRWDGRTLTVSGVDSVSLASATGMNIPMVQGLGTYDLSHLAKGVYILTVEKAGRRSSTKIIVK